MIFFLLQSYLLSMVPSETSRDRMFNDHKSKSRKNIKRSSWKGALHAHWHGNKRSLFWSFPLFNLCLIIQLSFFFKKINFIVK